MSKSKHHEVHKYFKAEFKKSKTIIFRCGLEGCPHFVYEPLIVGRNSVCWRCGVVYVITRKTTHNKKMHCEDCTRGRETQASEVSILMDELLSDFIPMQIEDRVPEEKEEEKSNEKVE